MPAFSFEKISPPVPSATPAASEKPRGVIVQILDRFVGVWGKPEADEGGAHPRQKD